MSAARLSPARAPVSAVVVLGFLTALGPLSIDLYLPAFPALQSDLATSEGMVQFTLAGMTIGLAAGQLVVGTWSDRVGRRRPLLLSTAVHVLASVGCALAPSIDALAAFRVVQGLGAAGSAVLVLAIVRDVAEGPRLVLLLSRVTLVTTTVPLLAPVAGAELLPVVGWRGIFGVLAAVSAVVLLATSLVVPETRTTGRPPARLRSTIKTVWLDRHFRRGTVVAALTYAGVYAYVAASPLLLQQVYGFSARSFAIAFLVNSLGLVAGVQLGGMLSTRIGTAGVLAAFTALTVLSAAAIVPLQGAGTGATGLLPCLFLFVLGCGGCFPCAEAIAFGGQGDQAGTATSIHGFVTFAAAGVVAPLAGFVGVTSATPVALVLVATSVTSLVTVGLLLRSPGRTRPAWTSAGLPDSGVRGRDADRRRHP